MFLKIGELAKRTGLTVRTLHHYDKIGLLKPSERSAADYRLYNRQDIVRLHRIQALRRLNLSLSEIAAIIDERQANLETIISEQLNIVEQQITRHINLRDRLQELQDMLKTQSEPELDDWLGTLEMMSVASQYFSSDELAAIRARHAAHSMVSTVDMRPLIREARAMLAAGVPPDDPRAGELAIRWITTMEASMPDSPRYLFNLTEMHRKEPGVQALTGVDEALIDYIIRASIEVRYATYRQYLSEHELRFFRQSSFGKARDWELLFSEIKEQMAAGSAPTSPPTQALLRRWRSLFLDAWGGDMEVVQKVRAIHLKDTSALLGGGLSQKLMQYAREGLIYLEQQIREQHQSTTTGK